MVHFIFLFSLLMLPPHVMAQPHEISLHGDEHTALSNDRLLKEQLSVNLSQSRKIKKTKRKLEKALNQLQYSQQEQAHLTDNLAHVTKKQEKLKRKCASLEQENFKKRSRYKQCKQDLQQSATKIESLESTIQSLRDSLTQQCATNAMLQKDILLSEATSSSICEEANSLKNSLEDTKKELLACLQEKKSLQEQLVQALQENEERSLLLTKLQNSLHIQERSSILNEPEHRIAHNRAHYEPSAESQLIINRLNNEIAQLSKQHTTACTHLQQLEICNQRLSDQLTHAHQTYAILQEELTQKELAQQQLQENLFAITHEKNTKEITFLAQSKELSCWKNEAQMLQLENDSLRAEHHKMCLYTEAMQKDLNAMNQSYLALQAEFSALNKNTGITLASNRSRNLYAATDAAQRRHKILRRTLYS